MAGKQYLRAALMGNSAECYFRLAEAFHTQSEPAFCGLATLVMVLNALEVDPGRKWKQNWRWYDESMFACCIDLEQVKKDGIDWRQWCRIACEQGLTLHPTLAVNSSLEEFRQLVLTTTASDDRVLVLNYNRGVVGQVGDGHYSPVGAYLAEEDMALIFDVARFKHPPHWLPLTLLWQAMLEKDRVTGYARGFAVLERGHVHTCAQPASCCVYLTCSHGRLGAAHSYFGGGEQEAGVRGALPRGCKQGGGNGVSHDAPPLPSRPSAARRSWLASLLTRRTRHPPLSSFVCAEPCCRHKMVEPPPTEPSCGLPAVTSARIAVRGAESAEEELWLAMRSMPAAAAALVAVRDDVDASADSETRAHFRRAREELTQTCAYRLLAEANDRFRRRDGPLPVSIHVCAVLALLLSAIVHEEALRELLPRAAPSLIDGDLLLADGFGSAIAEDILCSRGVLAAELLRSGIDVATRLPSALPPGQRTV